MPLAAKRRVPHVSIVHVACRSQCSILSQESPVTSFRDVSPYFQGLTMSTVAYAEMIESEQSSDQRIAAVLDLRKTWNLGVGIGLRS